MYENDVLLTYLSLVSPGALGSDFDFIPFLTRVEAAVAVTYLNPRFNQLALEFTPPSTGYGQDWVLVLDDASVHYDAP